MKNLLSKLAKDESLLPMILILFASLVIVGVFLVEIYVKFYLEVL